MFRINTQKITFDGLFGWLAVSESGLLDFMRRMVGAGVSVRVNVPFTALI